MSPRLLTLALLAACTTQTEEPDDSAADTGDSAADTGDSAQDTGDTGDVRRAPEGCALATMTPLTASSAEDTQVTWTLECSDLGDAASGTWTLELPGLGERPVAATVGEGGVSLVATVGGRVTLGRTLAPVRFDGVELLDLPVRFHQPPDVALAQLRDQAPAWNAIDATPQEASDGLQAIDTDDDGVLDALMGVGVDSAGHPTFGVADVAGGGWTVHTGAAVYDPASDEVQSQLTATTWGGGVAAAAILWRMRKRPELVYQEWDDVIDQHLSEVMKVPEGTFDEVVAVSPLMDRQVAALGVVGDRFVWWDGTAAVNHTALVGLTAADATSGLAAVGLYATIDTQTEGAPLADELRAWVLDARAVPKGGALTLDVVSPATGVRYRTVSVGTLAFTPEALTAAPVDLDADGTMDLVVEAWGGGEHAAFWVANADAKADSTPPVELVTDEPGRVLWGSPDGEPVAVRPSFRQSGGLLVAEELRLSPVEVVHVARVWAAEDVVGGNGAVRKSHRVSGEWETGDTCLDRRRGALLCGVTNHLRPVQGSGSGAASAAEPELVAGDLVAVAPGADGASTVITRAVFLDDVVPSEVVALDPDTCEAATLRRDGSGVSISGGDLVFQDESVVTLSGSSSFAVSGFGGIDCSGECVLHAMTDGGLTGRYTFDDAMSQDFRVIGVADPGEPVVAWSDADGSWAGVMDAAALAAGSMKGRGPIQLTGRANYAAAGRRLAGDPRPGSSFTPGEAVDVSGPVILVVRTLEMGMNCPRVSTITDLTDAAAEPVVLATSDSKDCSDLFVPIATLRGVPGAELAILSARPGEVRMDVVSGGQLYVGPETPVAAFASFDSSAADTIRVSGADLDGDGLEDLVLDLGEGAFALYTDGEGGFTELDASAALANTLGAVGMGPGLASCLDVEGGTPGWVAEPWVHDER